MNTLGLLIAVILVLAIISCIPTLIMYFLYKWLAKKGYRWIGLLIIAISISTLAYGMYTAIYPTDSFYFEDFKKVTSLEIPKSAEVIDKTASYPDFHGDYISCALIKLSKQDYKSLLNTLNKDKMMLKNSEISGSDELNKIMKTGSINDIKYSFSREVPGKDYLTYIGFFKNNESILVYFVNP
ncbi:hypothetical protein ACVW0P_003658 [Mucilaginibacter sp. UYNi724]